MISLAAGKTSGLLLVLISAGILLYANSSLAAEPAFDPQEQARQFILVKPNFNSPAGRVGAPSKTKVMPTVSARSNRGGYIDSQ